jgi:hypothetical protein
MKYLFLLVIFNVNLAFSQVSFPKVYCNGMLAENDQATGYFLPIQFKFEFVSSDIVYRIREGNIKYYSYSPLKVVNFDSNYVYSSYLVVGDSVVITITKLEITRGTNTVLDTTTLVKTIKRNRVYEISQLENEVINNNLVVVHINDALINPDNGITIGSGNKWAVSLNNNVQRKKINKTEVIQVRGKRPVRTSTYSSPIMNFSVFFQKQENNTLDIYPGDFLFLKVFTDDTNYIPKIIKIK